MSDKVYVQIHIPSRDHKLPPYKGELERCTKCGQKPHPPAFQSQALVPTSTAAIYDIITYYYLYHVCPCGFVWTTATLEGK